MKSKATLQRLTAAGCLVLLGAVVRPSPAAANYNSYTLDGCPAQGSNWNAGGNFPWNASTDDPNHCFPWVGVQFQGNSTAIGSWSVLRARANPKPAWTKHYFSTSLGSMSFQISCGC
jgi:hypothetical protein